MKKRTVAVYAQWSQRASIALNPSYQSELYSWRKVELLVSWQDEAMQVVCDCHSQRRGR